MSDPVEPKPPVPPGAYFAAGAQSPAEPHVTGDAQPPPAAQPPAGAQPGPGTHPSGEPLPGAAARPAAETQTPGRPQPPPGAEPARTVATGGDPNGDGPEPAPTPAPVRRRPARALPDLMNVSPWRAVWIMGVPGVARALLASAVQITNLIIVGHLGADAIAAVGIGNRVMFVIISVLGAVTVGTTALVARAIGQRDAQRCAEVIHQSMLLSVVIGLVLAVTGAIFSGDIVRGLLVTEPHADLLLQREAVDYMFWNLVPMIIGGISFTGAAIYQGAGDLTTPLWVLTGTDILSVGVAYALVYGLGPVPSMGVGGAGLATSLSRAMSAAIFIWLLLRRTDIIRWRPEGWRIDRRTMAEILTIGLPAGAENLLRQGSFIAFTMVVAALGSAALAAAQIVQSLQGIVFQIGFGFAIAATALVGQNLGARSQPRAWQCAYDANWISTGLSAAVAAAMFAFPHAFAHIYTNDPTVDHLTAIGLQIIAFGLIGNSVSLVLSGALRGGGDTTFVMYITASGTWFIRLAGAAVLGLVLHGGMAGVFLAMSADMTVRALITLWRWRTGAWIAIFERQEARHSRSLRGRTAEATM